MKRGLLVFALSMIAGMANASIVEIENISNYTLQGSIWPSGFMPRKGLNNLTIAPRSTLKLNLGKQCVYSIQFHTIPWERGSYEYMSEGSWGIEELFFGMRFCGDKEKFEIRVYPKLEKIEIKNVTGKK